MLSLTSCQNEESYQSQDIKIYENQKQKEEDESLQIDGLYQLKKDALIYADIDEKTSFDKLEAGTLLKVVSEDEQGFSLVDFNGQTFYIKSEYLEEI